MRWFEWLVSPRRVRRYRQERVKGDVIICLLVLIWWLVVVLIGLANTYGWF